MSELINMPSLDEHSGKNSECLDTENKLIEIMNGIVFDVDAEAPKTPSITVPISQLASLGAGVASLLPAFRTVTSTSLFNVNGLYRLANQNIGDTLKQAKNGNKYGAYITAEGKSKFVQLREAGPLSATNEITMPLDPATIMVAAALFAIEHRLENIAEIGRQIISFLETEKESEIEADMQLLSTMIKEYKYNWDNELFVASHYKITLDIKRTARKNMASFQKKVNEAASENQIIVAQTKVQTTLNDLLRKFKYYRMSLFAFSLASLLEILLSGNFKEEYILSVKSELEAMSLSYREIYARCSLYLEKISKASLEKGILKGMGSAIKAVGDAMEKIPVIGDGSADKFLQNKGTKLKKSADDMDRAIIADFAKISNPHTSVFIEKMCDLIQIYNHTEAICFDDKQIYLVAG